jgi:sortase A
MSSRRFIGFALIGAGLVLGGKGAWIPIKARLAQALLVHAWDERLEGDSEPKPWPWADTWPVAVLRAPRLGVERVVLSGASGRNMAFGPTHLGDTAAPGSAGNTVLSGHRDTHFAFLQNLAPGDELWLDTADRVRHRYRVVDLDVVDERTSWVTAPTEDAVLTLVTCYPFDAVLPGGPGRFVVRAVAEESPDARSASARAVKKTSADGGIAAAVRRK